MLIWLCSYHATSAGSWCTIPELKNWLQIWNTYVIFQDDESEFDHFQDEEEFEGFDSERVGGSGKLDDKEAPKITITKVWETDKKDFVHGLNYGWKL